MEAPYTIEKISPTRMKGNVYAHATVRFGAAWARFRIITTGRGCALFHPETRTRAPVDVRSTANVPISMTLRSASGYGSEQLEFKRAAKSAAVYSRKGVWSVAACPENPIHAFATTDCIA